MRRCEICGDMIPRTPLNINKHPHYMSLHQDFLAWRRKHRSRKYRIVSTPLLLITISLIFLSFVYGSAYRDAASFAAVLWACVFVLYFFIWLRPGWRRDVQQFARAWKAEHADSPAQ